MPKATPRKPAGAVEGFSLSGGTLKLGIFVLVAALIIGVSHYFSPAAKGSVAPPAAVKPYAGSSAVTALDDASFDKFVGAHPDGVLVDFYSKGCKFCTKLAPEFEQAAEELKGSGGPALASLDSEVGPLMMQKFGIDRYPTVLWFWKGEKVLEFPRAAEKPAAKIVEWAQWATGVAVQELETKEEFDAAVVTLRSTLHAKARLFVAFNKEGSEGMREALEAAAQRQRATTVFLYIKEVHTEGPMLKSFAQDAANDEDFAGATTPADVIAWVQGVLDKAKPAVVEAKAAEPEPKKAATKALDAVQNALKNSMAANAEAATDGA